MTVVSQIFTVMSSAFSWIVNLLESLVNVFYADSQLTFFGVLAIIGLGVSMFFLLMRVITNFLQFRA